MNKKLIAWLIIATIAMTSFVSAYYTPYSYNYVSTNRMRWDARYRGGIFGPARYSYVSRGYVTPNFDFQTPTTIGRDYYRTTNSLTRDYYRTQYNRYSYRHGYRSGYNCLPNWYYGDHGQLVRSQYNRCFQM